MLVYVVVFVVVIAFLLWAFRSMGAATLAPAAHPSAAEIQQWLRDVVSSLDSVASEPHTAADMSRLRAAASAARKQTMAWQHELASAQLDEDEKMRLGAAATSLLWACRLLESEDVVANGAVLEAATLLYDDTVRRIGAQARE